MTTVPNDAPKLPAFLLDGSHPLIVVDFPLPDRAYVRPDPWGVHDLQHEGCMTLGPALLGDGEIRHVPLPCHTPTCRSCGPVRCGRVRDDMRGHAAPFNSLHLFTIHALDERDLRAERRTVTQAINDRHGDYLWVTMNDGARLVCVVFASVDHSTLRPNRGNPPRSCDKLDQADALAYLDFLLWHGFVARRASEGWKLTDGERENKSKGTSTKTSLGQIGARNFDHMLVIARQLHAQDRAAGIDVGCRLQVWPNGYPLPPGTDRPYQLHLFDRARTEAIAQANARRLARPPLDERRDPF